jgi:predicted transcriptional regulator of viral defense system
MLPHRRPSWDNLAELAREQAGLFSARQAQEVGFSRALLAHHLKSGRLSRPSRGVYRIAAFPVDEQEELVAVWLATDREAVFSHETALQLHGLSDALPPRVLVTLPSTRRRRRLPALVASHFGEVPDEDRTWVGAVPVTTVRRTIADCARVGVQQQFIGTAIDQALSRGLVTEAELEGVRRDLAKG